ncbi:hypothetical protein [Dorea sp.]
MADNKRYKVIVSDRAKRMLGTHIRFMAQANKQAAVAKKERDYDCYVFSFSGAATFSFF